MKASSSGKEAFQRLLALLLVVLFMPSSARDQAATPLQRPVSRDRPMWLFQIGTGNCADPQKIGAQIPPNTRPGLVATGGPLNLTMPMEPVSERRSHRLHLLQPTKPLPFKPSLHQSS